MRTEEMSPAGECLKLYENADHEMIKIKTSKPLPLPAGSWDTRIFTGILDYKSYRFLVSKNLNFSRSDVCCTTF